MGRARNPKRDEAMQMWLDSGGTLSFKELAKELEIEDEARIRKWKSLDKWNDKLQAEQKRKKRGGQPGNKNAVGHGAPIGSKNAETHGAYSRVNFSDLSEEDQEYLANLSANVEANLLNEYRILMAKERDLSNRIAKYDWENDEKNFPERHEKIFAIKHGKKVEVRRIEFSESAFERSMKLVAERTKLHGRILKALDMMRAHGLDQERLALDKRKHALNKQKISGEFEINLETGEIDDTVDIDDDDAL